jgi:DNA polymerase-3 subunit delta
LKSLLQGPALAGALIVEAGNLKGDDALKQLFEKTEGAAAIACYPDEARDLSALADEVLSAAGLRIGLPAREALLARLGADRALSRAELDKLVLYVGASGEVTPDDIEAIVGDASEQTLDRAVTAAASGDGARAVRECDRAIASGESAQTIILATQRYFFRLHRTRAQLDQGRSLDDALRSIRPPLHFKAKDQMSAQLRGWSADRLVRALSGIARAAKTARLTSTLEESLAERLLMDLAKLARAGGKS